MLPLTLIVVLFFALPFAYFRYNEQNQPTGDARVAFANPQDAAEAVKRFNGTQLLGRTLRLTLLAR